MSLRELHAGTCRALLGFLPGLRASQWILSALYSLLHKRKREDWNYLFVMFNSVHVTGEQLHHGALCCQSASIQVC
jgi:hypothetical protein